MNYATQHLAVAKARFHDAIEAIGLGDKPQCAQLVREGLDRLRLAGEYPEPCAELVRQARTGKTHSHFVAAAARSLP